MRDWKVKKFKPYGEEICTQKYSKWNIPEKSSSRQP
jgi:hypothetical protein